MSESNKQARVQLNAHAAPLPPSATPVEAPATTQSLSVSVITRRRNPLDLASLGGRILSRSEFDAQYAADPDDFEAVRTFAAEYGLAVDEQRTSLSRRTITLTGTFAQMEQAFGIAFEHYEHKEHGTRFHTWKGSISVPGALQGCVESVLGLDTRPIAKPHIRFRHKHPGIVVADASAASGSFNPPQVAELYGFPAGLDGTGQCIGILELGGGFETSDLTTYFGQLGLKVPTVTAVSVDGGNNEPGQDPTGADGEVALDIQVAGSIANGAKIAVYFAGNTDQAFIDAITTAVHDTTNNPGVLSISWGGPESSWTAASRTSLDNACQSAAALGVTITVASGDSGSSDGASGNNVDFPASSPHVLGCGGTLLAGSGSTISSEVVWNDQSNGGGASGGGISTVFPLPTWQASAGVPASSSSTGGRGVPDVAGDGSPESGYNVLIDGSAQVVGGTSAVAPLWAALITLVNQQRATGGLARIGFVNPLLYADPSALRDITSGSNGTYKAAKGWDPCTGLGSPNGKSVLAALATASASGGTGSGTTTTPAPPSAPPTHKKHKHHEQ